MDQIFFGNLPNELIELTLSFIKSNKTRLVARVVCKTWQQYIGQPQFNIYLPLPSEVQRMANTFSRCTQFFSLKIHKADHLKSDDYQKLLSNLKNMISLEVSWIYDPARNRFGPSETLQLRNLTNLQRIEAIGLKVSLGTLLPHLTYLNVADVQFANPDCFTNLEHLSISKSDFPFKKYPTLPKLTTLKYYRDIFGPKINLYNVISNLKVFNLPPRASLPDTISLPNIEQLHMINEFTLTDCHNLTKLSIALVSNFGCIKSATNLRELNIEQGDDIHESSFAFMKDMKQLNSVQLEPSTDLSGKFLDYLNPQTLTHLTAGYATDRINKISSFVNLRELNLWIEQKVDLKILSTLSQVTWLRVQSVGMIDVSWVNDLTSLQYLHLSFKNNSKKLLDLCNLTNLTQLKVQSMKRINTLSNLTKLKDLEFTKAEDYSFLSNLKKLTRLYCVNSAVVDHVTNLQKLCELTARFNSNTQLASLTSLQKLTHLIVSAQKIDDSENISVDTLTLLTRLQTAGFSLSTTTSNRFFTWTKDDIAPEIAEKLPRLVFRPKYY